MPNTDTDPIAIVRVLPEGLDIINIRSGVAGSYDETNPLVVDGETITVLSKAHAEDYLWCDIYEGSTHIVEAIVDLSEYSLPDRGCGIGGAVLLSGSQIAALVGISEGELGVNQSASCIAFRVDPRL